MDEVHEAEAASARQDQKAIRPVAENSNSLFAPSNVVAVISLFVAAISVVFSLQQSGRAEISQQRAELLDYVGKVATLSADTSGSNHTFEIAALSSQAAALLPKVPDVPATVYSQLAQVMVESTDHFDKAESLLQEAQARATADGDIQQQIYVHRLLARIRYRDRDLAGMREERRISVELSQNYRGRHETTLRYGYAAYSLVFWAQDEATLGYCDLAEEHLAAAVESARFADSAALDNEIADVRKAEATCGPAPSR